MTGPSTPVTEEAGRMRAFHRLVANALVATVTNSFVWFAVTFWAYLETRSVLATAVIGGTFMLLTAGAALMFGSFVDRHRRRTSMLVSTLVSLVAYVGATVVWYISPAGAVADLGRPVFWVFVVVVLVGAVGATSAASRCPPR